MANEEYVLPAYATDAAAATAVFPDSLFAAKSYLGYDGDRGEMAFGITVPSSAPYKVFIPLPSPVLTVTVTVGGVSRTIIESTPGDNSSVQLDRYDGGLTFHSDDAGGSAVATVATPLLTVINARRQTRIEAELAAVQDAVKNQALWLAVAEDVDLSAAASTAIIASAAFAAAVSEVYISIKSATSVTTNPVISIGTNSATYDNIVDGKTLYGMDAAAAGEGARFQIAGFAAEIAVSDAVYIKVDTAATATALTADIYLRGHQLA